jgi:phosphohistidine phosphatase
MKLYLVQHGNAVSKQENPDRPLSEQGRSDLARVAGFIRPLKIEADYLWHSKKSRAAQTARILAEVIKTRKGISERDDIKPNDEIAALERELSKVSADVMIVGHMPFLGRLASELLSGSETANTVRFRQGGIVCLNYDKDTGWQIEWMVTPDVLTGT